MDLLLFKQTMGPKAGTNASYPMARTMQVGEAFCFQHPQQQIMR